MYWNGRAPEEEGGLTPPPLPSPGIGLTLHTGCGRGPRPTSEPPPCWLRAQEGERTDQLWGMAHRMMPWVRGHTTTGPHDMPGYVLPGAPQHILPAVN